MTSWETAAPDGEGLRDLGRSGEGQTGGADEVSLKSGTCPSSLSIRCRFPAAGFFLLTASKRMGAVPTLGRHFFHRSPGSESLGAACNAAQSPAQANNILTKAWKSSVIFLLGFLIAGGCAFFRHGSSWSKEGSRTLVRRRTRRSALHWLPRLRFDPAPFYRASHGHLDFHPNFQARVATFR